MDNPLQPAEAVASSGQRIQPESQYEVHHALL